MQDFFKRLLQVVNYQGFKNINDFALNGLKYDSSSKLNRLRDEKNKPSVEILLDIAHNFPKVNIHWLITGKGSMLLTKDDNLIHFIQEPEEKYYTENKEQIAQRFATLKENILLKEDIIKTLKEKIEVQEKQLVPLEDIIEKLENRIHSLEQFTVIAKEKLDIK
ncbi:hypothetical protein [Flavobacterium sp. J27]|uniref:hypothetical protein n=1 Tax=Flavobacterium sp. J27 TaxID=2060419 RepID=UPI001031E604|nr:hypothetical protein [Flavobacterium sp. J27]